MKKLLALILNASLSATVTYEISLEIKSLSFEESQIFVLKRSYKTNLTI